MTDTYECVSFVSVVWIEGDCYALGNLLYWVLLDFIIKCMVRLYNIKALLHFFVKWFDNDILGIIAKFVFMYVS